MTVDLHTMIRFDAALDRYMGPNFGINNHWRTMCHQSAKIAARALNILFPQEKVDLLRVEMKAKMADSVRFVHLGWAEDPDKIPGRYPMHWAVRVGSGLYDPTFWQLHNVRTPLTLPDEPFFYADQFFRIAAKPQHVDAEGFTWGQMKDDKSDAVFQIAYMVQRRPLPPEEVALLMPDGLAKRHARRVADLFRQTKI